MATFKTFEEIEAWKESRILLQEIRGICKTTAQKDFSFVDQITRAARSISANIAEGNDTNSRPEFIRFLSYAKRSAAEVRSHLYDALDEGYVSQEKFMQLNELAAKVGKMLGGLMSYLRQYKTFNP